MTAMVLVILALTIVVLLLTGGNTEVPLLFTDVKAKASIAYFGFLVVGVVVGLLLHK